MELLLCRALHVKEATDVSMEHKDFCIGTRSARLHEDAMPRMFTVILVEILLEKVLHTRLGDRSYEDYMRHVIVLFVLEARVPTLRVEQLDHAGARFWEIVDEEHDEEDEGDATLRGQDGGSVTDS